MKRAFDILAAGVALILLTPLFAVVALLIARDSPGSVLFVQERIGLNGRPFLLYKFRSMVVDAQLKGGYATARDDPRITRLGAFIRRTSIDELPQLINVLKGDMSIVGPRPDVPAQMADYPDDVRAKRNRVRPGITGLAQATVRSEATAEERTALDLRYVDEASTVFDVKIILMTVAQLFRRTGN
jgi:lipopolysaccharide/colanic/teichoic acid biosynthesis glycosyltransferase